jgi:hypothetical protein
MANGLASRLHQAIIPSSEQHYWLPFYRRLTFMQLLLIFASKVFFDGPPPCPRKMPKRQRQNDYFTHRDPIPGIMAGAHTIEWILRR